ncbi:hypothetical protein GCM10022288_18050 [Gryllotalpicola kribbensis]|uniref:Uncharacterized protein n=1 Tax=Gryllotalpicola kribbensis TaxID=993084 RepID=A0ABP8ASW1_9MICO
MRFSARPARSTTSTGEAHERRALIPILFGITLVLAGCSQPTAAQSPRNPPSTSVGQPTGNSSVPATPLTVSGGPLPMSVGAPPSDEATVPWTLEKVDRAANRIYLVASKQGCVTPSRVAITDTSTQVVIAVTGRKADSPCTGDARTLFGYITPPTAIGDRRVVHG